MPKSVKNFINIQITVSNLAIEMYLNTFSGNIIIFLEIHVLLYISSYDYCITLSTLNNLYILSLFNDTVNYIYLLCIIILCYCI